MSKELHDQIMNIACRRSDDTFLNQASRMLYKEGHRDARHDAAELALAASGGNAAPELPEPYCPAHEDAGNEYPDMFNGYQMIAYGKACAAASSPNAALVVALRNLLHLAYEFGIQSGVCCCGDDMNRHGNPMDCGHSPVDSGEYYTASAIEEARKALSAAGEEVGK